MAKFFEYTALAAAIVFAICLFGLLAFYSAQPAHERREQQQSEELKTKPNEGELSKSLWQRTTEDPVAFFTAWLMLFTAVLSAVAVIQLRFLGRAEAIADSTARAAQDSADAAKESADVAKKTLQITQRAYLATIASSVSDIEIAKRPTATLTLKNVGATPAYKVRQRISLVLVSNPPPQPLELDFQIVGPDHRPLLSRKTRPRMRS